MLYSLPSTKGQAGEVWSHRSMTSSTGYSSQMSSITVHMVWFRLLKVLSEREGGREGGRAGGREEGRERANRLWLNTVHLV